MIDHIREAASHALELQMFCSYMECEHEGCQECVFQTYDGKCLIGNPEEWDFEMLNEAENLEPLEEDDEEDEWWC